MKNLHDLQTSTEVEWLVLRKRLETLRLNTAMNLHLARDKIRAGVELAMIPEPDFEITNLNEILKNVLPNLEVHDGLGSQMILSKSAGILLLGSNEGTATTRARGDNEEGEVEIVFEAEESQLFMTRRNLRLRKGQFIFQDKLHRAVSDTTKGLKRQRERITQGIVHAKLRPTLLGVKEGLGLQRRKIVANVQAVDLRHLRPNIDLRALRIHSQENLFGVKEYLQDRQRLLTATMSQTVKRELSHLKLNCKDLYYTTAGHLQNTGKKLAHYLQQAHVNLRPRLQDTKKVLMQRLKHAQMHLTHRLQHTQNLLVQHLRFVQHHMAIQLQKTSHRLRLALHHMAVRLQNASPHLRRLQQHLVEYIQHSQQKVVRQVQQSQRALVAGFSHHEADFKISQSLLHQILAMPLLPDRYDVVAGSMDATVLFMSVAAQVDKDEQQQRLLLGLQEKKGDGIKTEAPIPPASRPTMPPVIRSTKARDIKQQPDPVTKPPTPAVARSTKPPVKRSTRARYRKQPDPVTEVPTPPVARPARLPVTRSIRARDRKQQPDPVKPIVSWNQAATNIPDFFVPTSLQTQPEEESNRHGFSRLTERGGAMIIIFLLLHTVFLLKRKQQQPHREPSVANNNAAIGAAVAERPTASATAESATTAATAGEDCPGSPDTPESLHTVSTVSDQDTLPMASPPRRKPEKRAEKEMELMRLLQRKQEECSLLVENLELVKRELTKRELEQPSLLTASDATSAEDYHSSKLEELNQSLQQLVEGKDLQLLNLFTQVQQLAKDLSTRESQMSNLLSLYTRQKEELEDIATQSSSTQLNEEVVLEQQTKNMLEMEGLLKESKTVCDELSERLAKTTKDLAQREGARSRIEEVLKQQMGKCHELEDQISQSHAETQEAANKLEEMTTDSLAIKQKMQGQIDQTGQLEGHLKEVVAQSSGLQEQLCQSVTRAGDLQEELKQVNAHCSDLKEQLAARPSLNDSKSAPNDEEKNDAHAEDSIQELASAMQRLEQAHAKLKLKFDDQVDQCQVLARQLEHQKKLYGKQHERNQLLLKTNQTLSDMMEERQQRCHELDRQVSSLTQSRDKKRNVDDSGKLGALRKQRQEKEEKAKQLLSTQALHTKSNVTRLEVELEEQKCTALNLRMEVESSKSERDRQLLEMTKQHQHQVIARQADFIRMERHLTQQLETKKNECSELSEQVRTLQMNECNNVSPKASERKEASSPPSPGLKEVLSSEVSMLFGLPGSP